MRNTITTPWIMPVRMRFGSFIASRRASFEKTIAENEERGSSSKVFLVNHNVAVSQSLRRSERDVDRRANRRQPSVTENRRVFQSVTEIEDEFEKIMSMGDDSSASSTTGSSGY